MTDQPPYRPLVGAEIDEGQLVERDLRELCQRIEEQGAPHHVVVAAIGSLAAGLIAQRTNVATASAWFFGCGIQCARIASDEIEAETKH